MVPRWDSFVFTICVFKCQQNSKEFCFPGNIDYSEYTKVYNYYSKRLFELLFVRERFALLFVEFYCFLIQLKYYWQVVLFTSETFLLINSPSYNTHENVCIFIYLCIYLSISMYIFVYVCVCVCVYEYKQND